MLKRIGYLLAMTVPGLALVCWLYTSQPHDAVSPVPLDQLGLAPDHSERAATVAQGMPAFQIFGADGEDNSRKNVRLWDDVMAVLGKHLPNVPQQIGDCVSHGTCNAINFLQCVQSNRGPPGSEFHAAFPPFTYGASRVTIGHEHGSHFTGDGSVGAYAAEASTKCGVLPADHPKCPPYDGNVARAWGRTGPPQWALDAAKSQRVRTVAQVTTAEQVRDAICNGYPVIICSQFGTQTIRPQDGRQVARHDASWAHCMCIVGYDGSGSQPYFYVLNSWGPDAHPKPLQGEPPGGFWITWKTGVWIFRSGDCWAFSGFDGFPARDLDLSPLRPHRADANPTRPRFVAAHLGGSRL